MGVTCRTNIGLKPSAKASRPPPFSHVPSASTNEGYCSMHRSTSMTFPFVPSRTATTCVCSSDSSVPGASEALTDQPLEAASRVLGIVKVSERPAWRVGYVCVAAPASSTSACASREREGVAHEVRSDRTRCRHCHSEDAQQSHSPRPSAGRSTVTGALPQRACLPPSPQPGERD
jgi:hypothetical protein